MLNSFLNSKDGMNQLQTVLNSLGIAPPNGNAFPSGTVPPNGSAQAPQNNTMPNIDMNMVGNILAGMSAQQSNNNEQVQQNNQQGNQNRQPERQYNPNAQATNLPQLYNAPTPNMDLSGLISMLSGAGNNQQQANNQSNMDLSSLMSMLSGVGNNQQKASSAPNMDLSGLMSMLSGAGNNQQQANNTPNMDLSGLMNMLGTNNKPANSTPSMDLSGLMSMLGGSNAKPAANAPNMDLSGLMSMLGGGNQQQSGGIPSLMPKFDLNTILLLQRAFTAISQPDKNTMLLMALKPHFSEERSKKVDDAVRILQLLRLLPFIKESGLLNLLGGERS